MWRTVAASVRGTSHLQSGAPCQDAHLVGNVGPNLLLVVSDGAGSAAHSQLGSELVCQMSALWLDEQLSMGERLDAEAGPQLVAFLRERLNQKATELQVTPRELACTLSGALLGDGWAWLVQIGDGAIVTEDENGVLNVVFWPDNGEYSNQTYFVTDAPDAAIHALRVEGVPERVALLTDGLHPLALQLAARQPHPPFFGPMFAAIETQQADSVQLAQFLDSPAVNARVNDDKTLILASRR